MTESYYKYPEAAIQGDEMILRGSEIHPDTVLTMDWSGEFPIIKKVVFDEREIPYEQVDVFFELGKNENSANLVIWE